MSIIYHNRHRLDEEIEQKYDARYVTKEELLKTSDFISLNAPSTPETIKMIGKREFEMMKPTAISLIQHEETWLTRLQ
jgi:lactate dehydrogenase-like 2-hydroxyacid dehydrogenase